MCSSRKAQLLLAVCLCAAVAGAVGSPLGSERAPAAATAPPPADCDAPKAELRRGKIRVFMRGQTVRTYYLCSEHLRKPRAYHSRRIDEAEDDPFDFGVRGRRLTYTDFIVTTQREALAWVDLKTAQYREVKVPQDREYVQIRALGPDGGIAFVTTEAGAGQRIWYAAARRTALAKPRIVARAADGDIVPGSLSISGATVRWRTPYGPRRSALLTGAPQTVPAASRTCDSRERLYRSGAIRIFFRTVGNIERFYLCSEQLRRPKLFLEKNPWTHPPIYGFRRFGRHLMFWIDWGGEEDTRGIGWVDLRTGRQMDVEVEGGLEVDEAVVGPDGAIAVRAGKELRYAIPGRRSLHSLRFLATISNGTPAKRSLAIRGSNVTWRTTTGQTGSVPVPRT